jgi:hypothetical protein
MNKYFYSKKDHQHLKICREEMIGFDLNDTFINGKPYTMMVSEDDVTDHILDYYTRWGDVQMVHQGEGTITK